MMTDDLYIPTTKDESALQLCLSLITAGLGLCSEQTLQTYVLLDLIAADSRFARFSFDVGPIQRSYSCC